MRKVSLPSTRVTCFVCCLSVRRSSFPLPWPRLVRVQVKLDDDTRLIVLTFELLKFHEKNFSEFRWCFAYHHADLHIIV